MAMEVEGPRADGRGYEEFRNLFINTKVISQARGSCYIEQGTTKILVGVSGPRQSEYKFGFSETGRLQCDVRFTSFASGGADKQAQMAMERSMASSLSQALEPSVQLDKFPKAVVDVSVLVVEAGGSELAAAITAASVALADAGLELHDLLPACDMARVGGQLLLDPTTSESANADGSALVALLPCSGEVTQLNASGVWGVAGMGIGAEGPSMKDVLELGMGACTQLRAAMREALLEGLQQQVQQVQQQELMPAAQAAVGQVAA